MSSIGRLGGDLMGSSGLAWANKFLSGRSTHKLDSLYIYSCCPNILYSVQIKNYFIEIVSGLFVKDVY
jgi:hypothetical protein